MQNCFNKGELLNFLLHIWIQKTNICITTTAESLVPPLCKLPMLCLKTDASFSSCITERSHQLLPFNFLSRSQDGQKMIVEEGVVEQHLSGKQREVEGLGRQGEGAQPLCGEGRRGC